VTVRFLAIPRRTGEKLANAANAQTLVSSVITTHPLFTSLKLGAYRNAAGSWDRAQLEREQSGGHLPGGPDGGKTH
jgi:hypothetical protein